MVPAVVAIVGTRKPAVKVRGRLAARAGGGRVDEGLEGDVAVAALAGELAGGRVARRLPEERIDGAESRGVCGHGVASVRLVDADLARVPHVEPA